MIISLVLLISIMIALLIFYRSNGFLHILVIYFLGISDNIIFGVLYSAKVAAVKNIDSSTMTIIVYLSKIKLRFPHIVFGWNFSFIIIFIASLLYINYLFKLKKKSIALLSSLIALFFLISDTTVTRAIFLNMHSQNQFMSLVFTWIFNASKYIEIFIIYFFVACPIAVAAIKYPKCKIFLRKQDVLISGLCVLSINTFITVALFLGVFRTIMVYNVNFVKIPLNFNNNADVYFSILLLWLIVVVITLSFVLFRPFKTREKYIQHIFSFNKEKNNKKLGMILHIYKNAFIGINQQLDLARHNLGNGKIGRAYRNIDIGRKISSDYITMLNKTLSVIGNPIMKKKEFVLKKCVEDVFEKAGIDDKEISICNDVSNDIIIFGDIDHLSEAFLNLVLNANESLKKSSSEQKKIIVSTIVDDDLVQINFYDNGIGIKKKDLKRVFNSFYSTKAGLNGGFGLSYVKAIISHHMGKIRAVSVVDRYTEFQMVLPLNKNKV